MGAAARRAYARAPRKSPCQLRGPVGRGHEETRHPCGACVGDARAAPMRPLALSHSWRVGAIHQRTSPTRTIGNSSGRARLTPSAGEPAAPVSYVTGRARSPERPGDDAQAGMGELWRPAGVAHAHGPLCRRVRRRVDAVVGRRDGLAAEATDAVGTRQKCAPRRRRLGRRAPVHAGGRGVDVCGSPTSSICARGRGVPPVGRTLERWVRRGSAGGVHRGWEQQEAAAVSVAVRA
jgi:hypothetical protein